MLRATKAVRRSTNLPATHNLKGPGVFLGQFVNPADPRFADLQRCAATLAACGMKSIELPLWSGVLIDLDRAAADPAYCDGLKETTRKEGVEIVRVTNHLDWQNVCASAALEPHFGGLCPSSLAGNVLGQRQWSGNRIGLSIKAAKNFGFTKVGGFSGHDAATHLSYPWCPVDGDVLLVARKQHAELWKPHLDAADKAGIDICWEIHPMQTVVHGKSFGEYLPLVGNHPRLQMLMDLSHLILQGISRELLVAYVIHWVKQGRVGLIHIKEALFDATMNCGTLDYGPFTAKAARFRGLGDGDIGYVEVIEILAVLGIVLDLIYEWEDCGDEFGKTKGKEQALREGAAFISALLSGADLPERTAPMPHNDGGFENSLSVTPADRFRRIANITGISEIDVARLLA